MPSPSGTDRQRRRLLREAADRFVTNLEASDPARPVPGLDWNVGELGAHLLVLPRLYREMAEQEQPMALPLDFHRYAAEKVAKIETRDVTKMARLIDSELTTLLEIYGDDPEVRFNHWVTSQPVSVLESTLFNEFLIHGWDLDGVTGDRRSISRLEAMTSLEGLLPVSSNFVDPAAAGDLAATLHLRLRGGDGLDSVDWTQTIANGAMTVAKGRPAKPDVHLNVDPATFLLLSIGRIGQVMPALTGKVIAYGRKPWLAARLSNIFVEL